MASKLVSIPLVPLTTCRLYQQASNNLRLFPKSRMRSTSSAELLKNYIVPAKATEIRLNSSTAFHLALQAEVVSPPAIAASVETSLIYAITCPIVFAHYKRMNELQFFSDTTFAWGDRFIPTSPVVKKDYQSTNRRNNCPHNISIVRCRGHE